MASLLLVLSLLLGFAVLSSCKITNQNLVFLPQYTAASYAFIYQGQIVVGLDVFNNATTGHASSIAAYSYKGVLLRSLSLSNKCQKLYCNTDTDLVTLAGSTLVIAVFSDTSNNWDLLSINLDNFTIIQQKNGPASLYPYSWIVLSPSTVLITMPQGLAALDVATLTIATPVPNNLQKIYGPYSFAYSDLVYACGAESNLPNTYFSMPSPYSTGKNTGIYCNKIITYVPEQQQVICANESRTNMSLQFIQASADGLTVSNTEAFLAKDAYITGIIGSAHFAFVSGRAWSDQNVGSIFQVKTTAGYGMAVDSITIPQKYVVVSNVGGGIDETNNVYFTVTSGPFSNYWM